MTRQAAPVDPPVVLTIAGSDSGGGAGIQADLKTIEAGGAFGTTAITSVTAQNTRGVERTHGLPITEIEAQIDAVVEDFDVAAVKTGMLGTSEVVETVVDYAGALPNLVVDPVMVAASGDRLLEPEAEAAYEELVAEAALVTPNADEAEVLTDVEVTDVESARAAGERLVDTGADAALVKGGHVPGDDVVDVLVAGEATRTYRHERVDTDATHGSGCTLSSAIATRLAHGDDLPTAVGEGVSLLAAAVRYGIDVGGGPGSVHHLVDARNEAARGQTVEAVEHVVGMLADRGSPALVPPAGTNVVGATPYAESERDVAGVDGGLGWTRDGLRPNRGVSFGPTDRLAALLVAVREVDPTARFALECRYSADLERACADFPGAVVALPSGDDAVGESLEARVAAAVPDGGEAEEGSEPANQSGDASGTADTQSLLAVVDDGLSRGNLALFAPDASTLVERTRAVLDALDA